MVMFNLLPLELILLKSHSILLANKVDLSMISLFQLQNELLSMMLQLQIGLL